MSQQTTTTTTSFFSSGLLLLFIGLKLANIITWSWWWVFAPVWIPVAIIGLVLLVAFAMSWFDN